MSASTFILTYWIRKYLLFPKSFLEILRKAKLHLLEGEGDGSVSKNKCCPHSRSEFFSIPEPIEGSRHGNMCLHFSTGERSFWNFLAKQPSQISELWVQWENLSQKVRQRSNWGRCLTFWPPLTHAEYIHTHARMYTCTISFYYTCLICIFSFITPDPFLGAWWRTLMMGGWPGNICLCSPHQILSQPPPEGLGGWSGAVLALSVR